MSELQFDLADVLAESREYIERNGWAQGEFCQVENEYSEEDEAGYSEIISYEVIGYCAMGGVLYSQSIDDNDCMRDPRTLAVADALVKALGIKAHHAEQCTNEGVCTCILNWVTSWNDHDDRTEQDVLDAFMKAEKDARSGNVDE